METMGAKLRKQRRRLGLTLDELALKTAISKPYLSLIETGNVPNPPSDEKLRRLERVLGFAANELVTEAHVLRTPRDVRAVLGKLLEGRNADAKPPFDKAHGSQAGGPVNLDDAYLSGALAEMVERNSTNVEMMATNVVPVINKVSAGYPKNFTDLEYPKGVADDYVGCPDVRDADAFACRVHGDSMTPKYGQGEIVIFSPAASPKNGDDCFVRFEDGQTTFKRVFFEKDEMGAEVLRLQPRNEKYRAQIVAAEKITGVWKAVYKYQSVEE
jgi:repressor LexA